MGRIDSRFLNDDEKWLATSEHLSKVIPGFEVYISEYDGWGSKDIDITSLQEDIRSEIEFWISNTPDEEIIETVKNINLPARKHLVQILPLWCRGFFEDQGGQFPIELSCPIPFFPYEKRLGKKVQVPQVIMKYGNTRITVQGTICKPDDLKGWVALNQIRKREQCEVSEGKRAIIVRPSFSDIAKELGSAEPWHPKVHKRIREMLMRLRSMSLSWEKGRGNKMKFYDGSLLHLTTNLSADNDGKLEIHMDRFFLELLMPQYNGFDEKVLYGLSGRQINMFIYLNRDERFNNSGCFNSRDYNQKYYDVYRNASLHSPAPISKQLSLAKIKSDLKTVLRSLKSKGIITKYSFTKLGYLRIQN